MSHQGVRHDDMAHDMSHMQKSYGTTSEDALAGMADMGDMADMTGTGSMAHMHHAGHVLRFRRLFWIMLALSIPTVLLSSMFADIFGYGLPDARWVTWVSPVLGTVIYAWGGRPFLSGAVDEIRSRQPGMMLLIALAITVAFLSSWGASLHLLSHELDFWWELALLVVIMLLGHWIEMRSLARSGSALDSLAALLPDVAERVVAHGDGEQTQEVAPAELREGDIVLVRPGGSVPADGVVIDGTASLDESMITGESRPVRRSLGDHVVAGTVATDSGLRVRVTAVGQSTALAGIQRLISDAQQSTSHTQRLADRAAGWLFWFTIAAAAITAIVWVVGGRPDQAVVRAISVLVIACPHALGLAIPLVVSIATEIAARSGVLVSDRLALERMRTVDTVIFDKTGTLTQGRPEVTAVLPVGQSTSNQPSSSAAENAVLLTAAAVEKSSEHPLAAAIVGAAQQRELALLPVDDFVSAPATGVSGTVNGHRVRIGGPAMLAETGLPELEGVEAWRAEGAIILHVVVDERVVGALRLADAVRPESKQAVAALHDRGCQVMMLTGDAEAVADHVAESVGIDRVFAQVRAEDKAAKLRGLQGEGRIVAMVGDGVNDAPALAQADVGLAIGAGTDVARGAAGIVLAGSDPRAVVSVMELSRHTYRKMLQNLWWAVGYNLIAVPLAAGVLAPLGFVLPMSVGALLMSASTVVVAINAQLLREIDLSPTRLCRQILGTDGGAEEHAHGIGHDHREQPHADVAHDGPATLRTAERGADEPSEQQRDRDGHDGHPDAHRLVEGQQHGNQRNQRADGERDE
ncbi:heavy metal translocating P-type ATPase [Pseudoclavibacter sp. CFCC 13611]|nr:heavy metal translocating P-type ATPase [Pseudoclavibacter sp. CFCC 13611]